MPTRRTDLLLLAGKIACIFMQAATAIGAAALIIAIPAILFFRDRVDAELAEEFGEPSIALPVLTVVGVMLIGLAIVAMLFVFFGRLRRIIGTVGEGDPFQPANADRLSQMGWLMLSIQLLAIPAAALGIQLARFAEQMEGAQISIDGGVDGTGILLTIILFILARVFRHGAAMREDLEGTV